jgi:hypothetical protein
MSGARGAAIPDKRRDVMPVHQFRVYRVIEHVQNREAYTPEDLAFELGMSRKIAQRHLKNLWTLDLMYICAWERQEGHIVPVYRWGNKPDVERLHVRTRAELTRRYRQKKLEKMETQTNLGGSL